MKFTMLLACLALSTAPLLASAANTYRPKKPQIYILGPKGGCYYINKNGNKTYVDRALCAKK
ncbi:hypothetical protein [Chitinimonas taiwanensis]|uniref:Uncharacterized protein n=1 Tax=Chitinimonas taiwanensis DSM 18899 TaxID=1121279 RepID=A0A1K2H7W4_9NEIS|nr:hypothetical protein [Chitinimonas taiwanensis]SFZ72743.1 hypothetical protein SAMN02745887_00708 [Chitinimonas taiwanensis DSM 18899]